MKAIVTGGAGFIGSHIVDALIERGIEVFVIDAMYSGREENLGKKFPKENLFKHDIVEKHNINKIFEKLRPEAVFHLAAQIDVRKSVDDPISDATTNIIGSLNVVEAAYRFGCQKFIFSSSGGAIYGDANSIPTAENHQANPISPYSITKLTVERYLHSYHCIYGLQYIALRYANVYGPRQNYRGEAGVVAIFCNNMLHKKPSTIYGDGKQTRDYVYVEDIVKANILALEKKFVGACNISTGIESDVNTIARYIKKSTGYEGEIINTSAKAGEVQRSCLDYSLAKKVLGWEPRVSLKDGLQKTVEWFKMGK